MRKKCWFPIQGKDPKVTRKKWRERRDEPATSCVTGRRSNQLNYAPAYIAPLVPDCSLPFPPLPSCVRNYPKVPCQRSVVRSYNNLQARGDCQTPRKSYKTSHSVGWVVG